MEKILIVEDDETVLNFENLELSHEGYTTVTATDGRQAMELFEKENPDLLNCQLFWLLQKVKHMIK